MTVEAGWRSVLRELDQAVTIAEGTYRMDGSPYHRGQLDAAKHAQQAVAAKIKRQQEKRNGNEEREEGHENDRESAAVSGC